MLDCWSCTHGGYIHICRMGSVGQMENVEGMFWQFNQNGVIRCDLCMKAQYQNFIILWLQITIIYIIHRTQTSMVNFSELEGIFSNFNFFVFNDFFNTYCLTNEYYYLFLSIYLFPIWSTTFMAATDFFRPNPIFISLSHFRPQ